MSKIIAITTAVLFTIGLAGCLATGPIQVADKRYTPPQVATGDVNGDNLMDIVIEDEAGIHLMLNLNYPNFSKSVLIHDAESLDHMRVGIALADITGDGRADLVVKHHEDFHIMDLYNEFQIGEVDVPYVNSTS